MAEEYVITTEDEEVTKPKSSGRTAQDQSKFTWNDRVLEAKGVIRMTNDLFDSEIVANQKSFVVIVISDRFKAGSQVFLESLAQAMEGLVDLGVRVGWVDILDNGELIKETFDIDRTPSGVYIH